MENARKQIDMLSSGELTVHERRGEDYVDISGRIADDHRARITSLEGVIARIEKREG